MMEQVDVLRAKLASRQMRMQADSAKKTRPAEMPHTPPKGKAAATTEGSTSSPAATPATPPQ